MSESLDSSLCKIRWSPNGHHLACGDINGGVHLYEAGEVRKGLTPSLRVTVRGWGGKERVNPCHYVYLY